MSNTHNDRGPTGHRVARNLRTLRTHQGWTYTELAAVCRTAGRPLPPIAIRRMEDGTRRIDVDDLATLADALGTPIDQILNHDLTITITVHRP